MCLKSFRGLFVALWSGGRPGLRLVCWLFGAWSLDHLKRFNCLIRRWIENIRALVVLMDHGSVGVEDG